MASLLEKIEVCFLDDRDPKRQSEDRWKVRSIRKSKGYYEIQINGVYCRAASWNDAFIRTWEERGYGATSYGTVHKDWRQTASEQYGRARSSDNFTETPLSIKACAVLGVHWPVNADEVKKAYRKLAKEAHPDAGGSEERFRQVQEAYEVLKPMVEQS